MAELLTAAEMRAIEAEAIASGTTGLDLMERAGAEVVAAILAEWPELGAGPQGALVLCGPGGNGGDGYVIARLLAERGWAVAVEALGAPDPSSDAGRMRALWLETRAAAPGDAPVIIDALFGIGLTRPLKGGLLPEDRKGRRVAVDIPSGLCADSGRVIGEIAFRADLTVTFHAPKLGHVLAEGPEHCGRLAVRDIGLRPRQGDLLVDGPDPDLISKRPGHKYDHGHALILCGGPGQGGAARLAARAALRIGAGLVTLAPPPAALAENAARLEAVMLRPLPDAGMLTKMLGDARITALCLGPGLGLGARESGLVAAALAAHRQVVLDADALTIIARDPALFAALHEDCILTPHGGEFARLFPDIAAHLAAPATHGPACSRLDAARAAAAEAGCTVLLKGPDTVIAAPDGRARIHAAAYARAAPWLATAGAGDVLSGLITGLLARGAPPIKAASTAAFLHVEAARAFGPGLTAEDLPETIPAVLRALLPAI